ncbi:hypothetical protein HY947_06960 [Candidatus Gottesmanbacteria bacterium]|nr:hypothetical protein [Candidatus Gottesmanbacteria bacterium]
MREKTQGKKQLRLEIVRQMVTLSSSALGLVAALAWNNVIQDLVTNYITPYLPKGFGILSLIIYAILITILAATVTFQLTKLVEKLEDK